MSGDKVIELLHVVTLECFKYDFAFAGVAGVNQHRLFQPAR